ncbi:MAG: CBS domain-containing protein [Actinomycetota bacterium]|nr:CBS domain-containing protein [Actinomycetota bacterium]
MQVRDAMTTNVLTLTPGTTVRSAARTMSERNIGAVVVLDPEQPGPGIFTERDLVRAIGSGSNPDETLIQDFLTSRAVFSEPELSLADAATTMIQGGFRHLVVVEHGTLRGILSMRDIMRVWRPTT